jgi:hypothetical protein
LSVKEKKTGKGSELFFLGSFSSFKSAFIKTTDAFAHLKVFAQP